MKLKELKINIVMGPHGPEVRIVRDQPLTPLQRMELRAMGCSESSHGYAHLSNGVRDLRSVWPWRRKRGWEALEEGFDALGRASLMFRDAAEAEVEAFKAIEREVKAARRREDLDNLSASLRAAADNIAQAYRRARGKGAPEPAPEPNDEEAETFTETGGGEVDLPADTEYVITSEDLPAEQVSMDDGISPHADDYHPTERRKRTLADAMDEPAGCTLGRDAVKGADQAQS